MYCCGFTHVMSGRKITRVLFMQDGPWIHTFAKGPRKEDRAGKGLFSVCCWVGLFFSLRRMKLFSRSTPNICLFSVLTAVDDIPRMWNGDSAVQWNLHNTIVQERVKIGFFPLKAEGQWVFSRFFKRNVQIGGRKQAISIIVHIVCLHHERRLHFDARKISPIHADHFLFTW